MSHRVTAIYSDEGRARLAAGDLQSAGVSTDDIRLVESRLDIRARDLDHAINVRAFLQEDGAEWAEIHEGIDEAEPVDTIPTVPAP